MPQNAGWIPPDQVRLNSPDDARKNLRQAAGGNLALRASQDKNIGVLVSVCDLGSGRFLPHQCRLGAPGRHSAPLSRARPLGFAILQFSCSLQLPFISAGKPSVHARSTRCVHSAAEQQRGFHRYRRNLGRGALAYRWVRNAVG